jgi:hypothetical protein
LGGADYFQSAQRVISASTVLAQILSEIIGSTARTSAT